MKRFEYQEQLDIQKYAKTRRAEISQFIEKNNPNMMTLAQAKTLMIEPKKGILYGVIDPLIVQALSYTPIRQVATIYEAEEYKKKWLISYWEEKYEIEIGEESDWADWNDVVELFFWAGYINQYPLSYSFPSCLIAIFLFVQEPE